VIDDDDDDEEVEEYDESPGCLSEGAGGVRKRQHRFGWQKNIQERRIPSFCERQAGADRRCTLVINDVRQSAMVEIDGVVRVVGGEEEEEEAEIVVGEEGRMARKANNRSVRVVDDRMFNGSSLQENEAQSNVRIGFVYSGCCVIFVEINSFVCVD